MTFSVQDSAIDAPFATQRLTERMLSPLAGPSRMIGFMSRGADEPRFLTAGAEMTGVHVLLGRPDPGVGFYHIGGSGILRHEALIRCLGETAERYAQFVADVTGTVNVTVASHEALTAAGQPVLRPDQLVFFSTEQHARADFPFGRFAPDTRFGWVKAESLIGDVARWLPAQLLLVGYRRRAMEPRLMASVTTGTAAHTVKARALRNALLEIVQIDAAMGHWYSDARAPRIRLDGRTRAIIRLIERHWGSMAVRPAFHLLRSPDLPGFVVACVLRKRHGVPVIGIGLGIALRLNHALYAALLEGVGVAQMAKKGLLDRADEGSANTPGDDIYDLDANVLRYALGEDRELLATKFDGRREVAASDLAEDIVLGPQEECELVGSQFAANGKQLFRLDLTAPDLRDLGLVVERAWSPETLGVSLPSAPPLAHPRFRDYGGATHSRPHPYP